MKPMGGKKVVTLALAAFAANIGVASLASAHEVCTYDRWGRRHCTPHRHTGPDAVDGFFLGLLVGLFSSWTTLTDSYYHSETLLAEAAFFLDTGSRGAVFAAFASQMIEQVALEAGKDVSELPVETLDRMIAEKLLESAE